MRTNNRILKIRHSNFPNIAFVAGNGEHRTIDLKKHFKRLNLSDKDFGYQILKDKNLFNSVSLEENALAWKQLQSTVNLPSGKSLTTFFHLDPIMVLKHSEPEMRKLGYDIGQEIREERLCQDMSQQELAEKIGTSKHYISKLENSKTDFEFKTLQKVVELGLGKNIHLTIYSKEKKLRDLSDAYFDAETLQKLNASKKSLTMIEGIEKKEVLILKRIGIESLDDFSKITFQDLLKELEKQGSTEHLKHFETWQLQARLIIQGEWLGLITIQRAIGGGKEAKVEAWMENI